MVMINHLKNGMILQVEELYPSDWRVNTSHVNTHGNTYALKFRLPYPQGHPKGMTDIFQSYWKVQGLR